MDAESLGDDAETSLLGQPHAERRAEPTPRAGGKLGQRSQPVDRELAGQPRVAAEQQLTGALARASGFDGVVDLLKTARHGSGEEVYLVEFHYEDGPG